MEDPVGQKGLAYPKIIFGLLAYPKFMKQNPCHAFTNLKILPTFCHKFCLAYPKEKILTPPWKDLTQHF